MHNVLAAIRLIRPVNCLLAAISVLTGAYLTSAISSVSIEPVLAATAAFLVCAAGNAVNDLVDIEIDRINRPDRTLVRGLLSIGEARLIAIGFNLIALVVAALVSPVVLFATAGAIILLYVYNYVAKRIVILGNVIVALLGALTFMTGGLAIDTEMAFYLPGPLIAAVFAFIFHFCREIVKDAEDLDGDSRRNVRTLPSVIGTRNAIGIVLLLMLVLTVLTYIPAIKGWYSSTYKILAVYILDLPLLAFLIFLWGDPSRRMLQVASQWLKAGMVVGLAALLAA